MIYSCSREPTLFFSSPAWPCSKKLSWVQSWEISLHLLQAVIWGDCTRLDWSRYSPLSDCWISSRQWEQWARFLTELPWWKTTISTPQESAYWNLARSKSLCAVLLFRDSFFSQHRLQVAWHSYFELYCWLRGAMLTSHWQNWRAEILE